MVIQACWAQDPSQRPTAGQVAQVLEDLWQKAFKAEQSQPTLRAADQQPDAIHQPRE